jgi:hypothetical protein
MDAVVLPSAKGKDRFGTGGQHTADFDPLGRDLKQNIVIFGPDGIQRVTQVTGRELSAVVPRQQGVRDEKGILRIQKPGQSEEPTPAQIEKLGIDAEDMYRSIAVRKPTAPVAPAPVAVRATLAIEEDIVPAPKKRKKTRKRAKRAKTLQRVAESEAPQAEAQPEEEAQTEYSPVVVGIDAPFGQLQQTFSGIFRDNIYLILYTDQRRVPSVYTLPQVEDPIPLTIRWQDKVVPCIWAGIQFTMPHAPITFTVLLINEESNE